MGRERREDERERLSPWWVRVLVFAAMAGVAWGAIEWIDERAMERMYELREAFQKSEVQSPKSKVRSPRFKV